MRCALGYHKPDKVVYSDCQDGMSKVISNVSIRASENAVPKSYLNLGSEARTPSQQLKYPRSFDETRRHSKFQGGPAMFACGQLEVIPFGLSVS